MPETPSISSSDIGTTVDAPSRYLGVGDVTVQEDPSSSHSRPSGSHRPAKDNIGGPPTPPPLLIISLLIHRQPSLRRTDITQYLEERRLA